MLPARLLLSLASSVLSEYIPSAHDALARYDHSLGDGSTSSRPGAVLHRLAKRDVEKGSPEYIAFACLIPVLVILSGVFAGLTLGYMSLDETQLNVLRSSGTPKQREYANKIMPIRKNGHLLLVTLLLANMIVNETLPVISDPILGGGVEAVVVSTVLIVLFSEIIPQSVCTRHGLYIGAKMAGITRILIYVFGIVAWPVAKFIEFILGPHHGIIYRRGELKELIALHGSENPLGGDLRTDTVTIIGATLDLQDKTVRHAMTPIDRVFMLHIDAKLDYDTLRRVCSTGHSRIPVYEEVEVNVPVHVAITAYETGSGDDALSPTAVQTMRKSLDGESLIKTKVKKIVGILLVKQCVLLDPEDAVPVRKMRLNKVPFVPQNEPLLGILDRFQEGRSHLAIISRLSVDRAQSVKKAVRKGLTQRLLGALHGDSSSDTDDDNSEDEEVDTAVGSDKKGDSCVGDSTSTGDDAADRENDSKKIKFEEERGGLRGRKKRKNNKRNSQGDLEKGDQEEEAKRNKERIRKPALEQRMPADAVLSKANAEEYLASQAIDPSIMPLGIITLEDVLEELIGEEIYDEFDVEGTGAHSQSFVPPGADQTFQTKATLHKKNSAPELAANFNKSREVAEAHMTPVAAPPVVGARSLGLAMPRPIAIPSLKNLGFLRSRSAPPTPRDANKPLAGGSTNASPSGAATPVTGGSAEGGTLTPAPVSHGLPENAVNIPVVVTGPSDTEVPRGLSQIAEGTASGESPTSEAEATVAAVVAPTPTLSGEQDQGTSPSNFQFAGQSIVLGPRSDSPGPSLEALLLERKRRGQATAGGAGANTSVNASGLGVGVVSPGVSGGAAVSVSTGPGLGLGLERGRKGGFKSSPLSPLGADASVVVAEDIKKQRERKE
ncbi:hypothetical protein M0805_009625 [Coniferiporia weirii]|nr:hypothetical protein M0805_009625 [Coniferiporia weirii]